MGIYQEVRTCGCHFEITSYNGFQIYPLRFFRSSLNFCSKMQNLLWVKTYPRLFCFLQYPLMLGGKLVSFRGGKTESSNKNDFDFYFFALPKMKSKRSSFSKITPKITPENYPPYKPYGVDYWGKFLILTFIEKQRLNIGYSKKCSG